jgi:hypothetical protein
VKTLSIRQPWAWAILCAGKDIENRGWATGYRGALVIHAGLRMDARGRERLRHEYGIEAPADLPRGGLVGRVRLVDCVTTHPSQWFEGPYGLVLSDPEPLPFVSMAGQLGLFEVPDDDRFSFGETDT